MECIAAVGWNTSLRTAGENIQNTNEAAEKIDLEDEQETDDTNEKKEDENGTSYSGESDEADDDF